MQKLIQLVVPLAPRPAAGMHTLANRDDVAYHAVRSLWVAAVWIQLLLSPPVSERNSSSALRDWNHVGSAHAHIGQSRWRTGFTRIARGIPSSLALDSDSTVDVRC